MAAKTDQLYAERAPAGEVNAAQPDLKATMTEEVSWHYRFRNFSRTYAMLSEALDQEVAELNELVLEGAIQRFGYTFQLAWLTLKDRLEYGGIVFTEVTPRNAIQQAVCRQID